MKVKEKLMNNALFEMTKKIDEDKISIKNQEISKFVGERHA